MNSLYSLCTPLKYSLIAICTSSYNSPSNSYCVLKLTFALWRNSSSLSSIALSVLIDYHCSCLSQYSILISKAVIGFPFRPQDRAIPWLTPLSFFPLFSLPQLTSVLISFCLIKVGPTWSCWSQGFPFTISPHHRLSSSDCGVHTGTYADCLWCHGGTHYDEVDQ
jgi:hypothetical protein